MRRRDEVLVGITIIASLTAIIFGALWLSSSQLGVRTEIRIARFRTTGGLGVGDPVMLRGVRVGRVKAIRLGDQGFVEADLQINESAIEGGLLPPNPGVIAASASFFGEWEARLIDLSVPPDDPNVLSDLQLVMVVDDDAWPGATLPDIGQLTAQASRIAGDITEISSRITTVFDDEAVGQLQQAIRDFTGVVSDINEFAGQQTEMFGEITANIRDGSNFLTGAAQRLQTSIARVDSATNEGELATILDNTAAASGDVRVALADLRSLVGVARANQASLVRLIQGADTLMTRLQTGAGTAGLLLNDSALYIEATMAVSELRSLIADIQANPRKYFKFSVF